MNTQQLVRLWNEFCDEDMGEYTFKRFMDWLQDKDTTPNPHRYQESHVEGRRYTCLTRNQVKELFHDLVDKPVDIIITNDLPSLLDDCETAAKHFDYFREKLHKRINEL